MIFSVRKTTASRPHLFAEASIQQQHMSNPMEMGQGALKGWSGSSLLEHLNHQADILAKGALIAGLNGALLMEGDFLLEPIHIKLSGKRICGSIWEALEANWGYCTARALFNKKYIVRMKDFDLI